MPFSDKFDDFGLRQEALADLMRKVQEEPLDLQNSLAPFTASADSYQEKVIVAEESTIRLVAPAGSGKTQTIVNRILQRIKKGVKPSRIIALTFDNAAAT